MKAGDKAWIFLASTQEITEYTVTSVVDYGGKTYVEVEFEFENGSIGHAGGFILGQNIFPTREELCEHYRKIFD